VLRECMSELVMNSPRFSTTNIANDSTYCDCRGRMFKFLKRFRHEVL